MLNRVFISTIAVAATISTAFAFNPEDPVARRQYVPYVRALTDCFALVALEGDQGALAWRNGTLPSFLRSIRGSCQMQLNEMVSRYDEAYGVIGGGQSFLEGPYFSDLPRAVLARDRKRFEQQLTAIDQKEAAQRTEAERQARQQREEQARQQAEREQRRLEQQAEDARKKAEYERQRELQQQELERKKAEARAAELRAEEDKRQRLEVARKSQNLLREAFFGCTTGQLKKLVRANESAEVLANAAMTICADTLRPLFDSAIEIYEIDKGVKVGEMEKLALQTVTKNTVRETVIANAVQIKAGAN